MRFFIIIFVFILPVVAMGQHITVSGKVEDGATAEALGFASVGLKGKSMGTISNLQGEFDFHVPVEYKNEILVVSMLGYRNFEVPVWALLTDSLQIITLEKSTILLPEVIIKDSLNGGDILRIALSRITQTFPMEPFLMEGFYRDIKKVGGSYISLLEAAVKIYDDDYGEPRNKYKLRERVSLDEVRQSYGYESKFTAYFDQDNLLEDLLLNNNIRYRQIDANEELLATINREDDSYYNGHEIFVVSHSELYKLKVFIDKQDFAIVHLEYETGMSDDMDKRKNLVSKFAGLKKVIDFKRYEGRMYLNYMTLSSKINWYDTDTKELKFETELFQQLLINEVRPKTNQRISANKKMHSYGLQYQDLPYNKEFWKNYNMIKDTPLDKEVLKDLEKHAPLEQQFEGE